MPQDEPEIGEMLQLPEDIPLDEIAYLDLVWPKVEGEVVRCADRIVSSLQSAINGDASAVANLRQTDPGFVLPRGFNQEWFKWEAERLTLIGFLAAHGEWRAVIHDGRHPIALPQQSRAFISLWLRLPENERAVRARLNVKLPINFYAEDATTRH
jgi:hypothetical protein